MLWGFGITIGLLDLTIWIDFIIIIKAIGIVLCLTILMRGYK